MEKIADYGVFSKDVWNVIIGLLQVRDILKLKFVNKTLGDAADNYINRHPYLLESKAFMLAVRQYPRPLVCDDIIRELESPETRALTKYNRFFLFNTRRKIHPTILGYDGNAHTTPARWHKRGPLDKLAGEYIIALVFNDKTVDFGNIMLEGQQLTKKQLLSLCDAHGCSIFIIAAALGRTEQLKQLLKAYNGAPEDGDNQLDCANNIGVLYRLVDTRDHSTMLHWAIVNKHVDTIKFILSETGLSDEQKEVLLKKPNYQKNTALHLLNQACEYNVDDMRKSVKGCIPRF